MVDYKQTRWYQYSGKAVQDLAGLSFDLLEDQTENNKQYVDYGFIVFPLAKGYEGFLKQVFFDMGLINKQQFTGEHFRIGKALNPNLPIRYRSGWVFEDLVQNCKGDSLPLRLWDAWKIARNQVFHYFPGQDRPNVTLERATFLVHELSAAMEEAIVGCDLKR